MVLPSTQPFKPSDKFSTLVYQVPYETGFEEKFIVSLMEKDKNDTEHQASGFDKLNSYAGVHANFCRSLLEWEGISYLIL